MASDLLDDVVAVSLECRRQVDAANRPMPHLAISNALDSNRHRDRVSRGRQFERAGEEVRKPVPTPHREVTAPDRCSRIQVKFSNGRIHPSDGVEHHDVATRPALRSCVTPPGRIARRSLEATGRGDRASSASW